MRSYQILTIIGALFVAYDLIFAAHQLSLSVLAISAFAIISMLVLSTYFSDVACKYNTYYGSVFWNWNKNAPA
jgi:hypothetical protein